MTSARAGHRRGFAVKRLIDVVVAVVAVVVSLPLTVAVTLLILVRQGRPVFFRHERPGLHGQPFTMIKFRTMRAARADEVWYATDGERVTAMGRILRATSLDELPELLNVLRGDMSLVGPRPLLTEYLEYYSPEQRRRHDMRPGITGWAAVNGRHALKFDDRLALDVWYVDHWSLRLDLRIVVMTVRQLLRRADVEVTQDLGEVGFPLPGVRRADAESTGPEPTGPEPTGPEPTGPEPTVGLPVRRER
jgi:lipopolysaccharide/colanic/teichoic acid biosynthesis glycosyltransferase